MHTLSGHGQKENTTVYQLTVNVIDNFWTPSSTIITGIQDHRRTSKFIK